ncbi:dynein axonemal heavy chain 1 [Anopheles maculipalpis]|uniref:dynein axonemal heavy chain 1 n=1 Tax=Anopheles maculipalpis TaxID=1496333 RepID=UPI0021595435|nr:dynein axonemal heavy chain 1 [Anopheles maculipalpis]
MMRRKTSRISPQPELMHMPWRISLPDKKPEVNKELLLYSSNKLANPISRAPKCNKYQFILDYTVQRVANANELEAILQEKSIYNSSFCTPNAEQTDLNSNDHFLPLEMFDDWEYDTFDPEALDDWRKMEALAILPPFTVWQRVHVLNHEPTSNYWEVRQNDTSTSHRIPRHQLYLPFEDPYKFADRIVAAQRARKMAENAIRFRFLCKHLSSGGCFAPGRTLEQSVLRRTSQEVYTIFKNLYESYHIALAVGKHLNQDSTMAIKQPTVGCLDSMKHTALPMADGSANIAYLLDCFRRTTLLCDRNVFHALRFVNQECEMVRKLPLFIVANEKPIPLEEYEKANLIQTSKTMKYLQNSWIERSTMHLHRLLSRIGDGNFNIKVTRWNIYSVMKLKRLVEQVLYRMQDALRDLLLDSTTAYVHYLVNDCSAILSIEDEAHYTWDGNLIDSPFEPKRPAVFYLTLEMGQETPYYSTDPDTFPATLRQLMDGILTECHFIHTVEPSFLQSLIFAENLFLSSVGLLDPIIVSRREALLEYYQKSLLPLKAYAARYTAYRELFFTNVKEFIEHIKSADKTSSEIKEDIAHQIRMRENLEHTVPLYIVIGPYWINVQPLREALIRKRLELTAALLKMLTEKLCLKTADVIGCYNTINERMCEKPVSIEHIYDIRAYMEDVPELVGRLEDRMRSILYEYEILDGFLHNLPDADFQQKWNALAYPRLVLKQLVSVKEFHESEVDRFRKQQFADEAAFTASIEDINAYISKFTTLYDVSKVSEMSVEVRRLWKALQELIEQGHIMNRRQELFEMAPISLNNLYELRTNFKAYRELWTVAADYLKLEETWIGNPLASVDLEGVRRGLQQTHDGLKDLLPLFCDQPQLLAVVEHFILVVESFRPNLDIMELLKCPYLEAIHWGQLAKEIGVKGKLSVDVGFDVFLEHGFRDHLETVRRVVVKAEQQRLEQEARWAEEERIRQIEENFRRARAERRQKRTEI